MNKTSLPVINLLDCIRPDFIDHDVIVYDHDGKGLTDEVKKIKLYNLVVEGLGTI